MISGFIGINRFLICIPNIIVIIIIITNINVTDNGTITTLINIDNDDINIIQYLSYYVYYNLRNQVSNY